MKTLKTTFAAAFVAFTLFAFAGADQAQAGWKKDFKGGFRHGHIGSRFDHNHHRYCTPRRVWVPGYYVGHGCHAHWIPGHYEYVGGWR